MKCLIQTHAFVHANPLIQLTLLFDGLYDSIEHEAMRTRKPSGHLFNSALACSRPHPLTELSQLKVSRPQIRRSPTGKRARRSYCCCFHRVTKLGEALLLASAS